jgi:hypothetical protein
VLPDTKGAQFVGSVSPSGVLAYTVAEQHAEDAGGAPFAGMMTAKECAMAESITWSSNFEDALKAAQQSGKPVLLDFSAAPM